MVAQAVGDVLARLVELVAVKVGVAAQNEFGGVGKNQRAQRVVRDVVAHAGNVVGLVGVDAVNHLCLLLAAVFERVDNNLGAEIASVDECQTQLVG